MRDAIRDPATVVGVVLNTIDDALDRGREGDAPHWHLDGLAYLRDLLDEAWRSGRPVILTADHGHVLDRGAPIRSESADSARYRTGTPGEGELTIKGPRVLAGGGEIVAAWEKAGQDAMKDFNLGAADYRIPQKWELGLQNSLLESLLSQG